MKWNMLSIYRVAAGREASFSSAYQTTIFNDCKERNATWVAGKGDDLQASHDTKQKSLYVLWNLVVTGTPTIPTEAESPSLLSSSERTQLSPTPGSCRFPYSRSWRISFVSIAMRHCCSVARRRSMVRRLDDTDGRTRCVVCTFRVYNGNTHSRKMKDLIAGF